MGESGKELGVDLYDLIVVAKDYLPTISGFYGGMVSDFGRAEAGATDAMRRSEHFGGGALGPVYTSWLAASHAATQLLASTRSSLDDTSTALVRAVALYAKADQAAADELNAKYSRHQPTPSD